MTFWYINYPYQTIYLWLLDRWFKRISVLLVFKFYFNTSEIFFQNSVLYRYFVKLYIFFKLTGNSYDKISFLCFCSTNVQWQSMMIQFSSLSCWLNGRYCTRGNFSNFLLRNVGTMFFGLCVELSKVWFASVWVFIFLWRTLFIWTPWTLCFVLSRLGQFN